MRRFIPLALLLFALASTFLVYRPGLQGPFMFDDGPNITKNGHLALQNLTFSELKEAAFSSDSGPLKRPISMVSFAINYYLSGLDPFYFKLTNVGIHVLNGIALSVLTNLLLRVYRRRFDSELSLSQISWISLGVASAWLLHPFNLTSVLYVVQRMTSLSVLFGIWGLALYVWGRLRQLDGHRGAWAILASLVVFTPLSALCKETGAILPLLMFVIEVSLFNFDTKSIVSRHFLIGFFTVTVALPAIVVLGYIAMHPAWLPGIYITRPFTLSERLMTEARVLWFYIRSIVLPSNAQMGLFHDDIPISQGLLQPATTLLSIMALTLLLSVSVVIRKKAPLITFGVLFFLSGHLLESSVFPLEITFEHRNYLPMYGLILTLFFYVLYPLRFKGNLVLRQLVAVLLIAVFAFSTFARAGNWSNPFEFAETEVAHHPNSPRDNGEMANVYANINTSDRTATEINYMIARYHYEKAVRLSPDYTNGLFGLIQLSALRGKTIEPEWIDMLEQRLANAPYAADVGDQLMGLMNCQANGICKLANKDVERILQAPFKNRTLTGPNRALALSARIYYVVNVKRDYPAAISAMQEAIAASPHELEYRMTLIKFLIALQRHDEAKSELDILKRIDTMHVYTSQVELQEKLLNDQRS